jgi:hypothetical protein
MISGRLVVVIVNDGMNNVHLGKEMDHGALNCHIIH